MALRKRVLGCLRAAKPPANTPNPDIVKAVSLHSILEVLVYTTRPTGTPREMLADALDIFMYGIKS